MDEVQKADNKRVGVAKLEVKCNKFFSPRHFDQL